MKPAAVFAAPRRIASRPLVTPTSCPPTIASRGESSTGLVAVWDPAPPPPSHLPTTSDLLAATRSPTQLPTELEAAILATLTRPLAPGETHHAGNARRELELRVLFARLDVVQAYQLGRRLDLAPAGDAIVAAFGRLVVERRQRLRAWLGDARRRSVR